jgi:hypothetical protein
MDRPMMDEAQMTTSEEAPKRCGGLMKVVLCVLVILALVVGAGYFFGAASSLRNMVFAGGSGSAEQRTAAHSVVATLSSQAALYKLQHNENYPDFVKYPNWEQFLKYTNFRGNLFQAKTPEGCFGPYMMSLPKNPLNGLSTVAVVAGPVNPGDATPNSQKVGFVFETANGRFFVTNTSGTKVIDPNAAQ